MLTEYLPLWLRRTVYVIALAFFPVAVAFGWLDDSTAAKITGALAVMLAPAIALAHPTPGTGRHRAE